MYLGITTLGTVKVC